MDEIKINWFTKLLLRYWSRLTMKFFARKLGIENPIFARAHGLFSKTNRIDIFPIESGYRGFIIVIDRKTALYFYQDGNHFVYDGYEMGEYEKGDVTVFDSRR